jgi:hypothetical protein
MSQVPERPLTRLDASLLGIALALGIAWSWASWPILQHIYVRGPGFYRSKPVENPVLLALHLASTVLTPPTWLVVVLAIRSPRPGRWRRCFRQPGVAACVGASAVLLAEVARFPVRLVTLYGELTRFQGHVRNNIVQYPRMPDGLGYRVLVGSIAHDLGPHAGLAVLGVVLAFWSARIPTDGSSWIDRLGRVLAACWVALAIGFLVRPTGWEW